MSAGQFKGKVAIVTGGGSGIGRATSLAFGREGAHVAVADIAGDKAQAVASEIVKAGGSALPITVDVGDSASVKAMIDAAVARFGRLDILFNNAGISGFTGKTLTEVDEEVFDAVMRVNVKGVWLGMKLGIPAMLKNGGGCIVNTASTLGWIGQKFSTTYGGSKHAVIGLTKSTSIEYGLKGIRVNAVCPGGIETPITEKFKDTFTPEEWRKRNEAAFPSTGRYGKPEEIAGVVLFLCSDAASNVHGIALLADGGYVAQ